MKKLEYSALEKEMANFNFEEMNVATTAAKANFTAAASASDIAGEICRVWSKIGRFVKLAEAIPVVGKFITILADLLDSLCKVAKN